MADLEKIVAELSKLSVLEAAELENQHRQHDERHGVHARLVDREHKDRSYKQRQNNCEVKHGWSTLEVLG